MLIAATHTHTAPAPADFFGAGQARDYIEEMLRPAACRAVREAHERCAEVSLKVGDAQESGLAFIRRYWTREGHVVTNPPKGASNVEGPEDEPDHTVRVFAFERNGSVVGLIVCAANHCDTIGGNLISADWPGLMIRRLREQLGPVPILYLNGFAGDVNHFDPKVLRHQANYQEAEHLGDGYAAYALEALQGAQPAGEQVVARRATVTAPLRKIPPEAITRAREIVARTPLRDSSRLTAEELAKGDPAVERIFAQELLRLAEGLSVKSEEEVVIAALALGGHALVFFPGEPFTALARAVRQRSPFLSTTPVELYEHYFGYIPMPEHFERGGYETLSTEHNRLAPQAGATLVDAAVELLESIRMVSSSY